MKFDIQIDSKLSDKLMIGVCQFENIHVRERDTALVSELEQLCHHYQQKIDSPEEVKALLSPMRELYRSTGNDPTKMRPSSEALFRRASRGKGLFKINTLVDVCNFCSLTFMLSIGLYDADKIEGETISIRLGKENEGYPGIGKEYVNVHGRIALFDRLGPFGNPSSDSFRTRITESTKNCLFVVFAPRSYSDDKLQKHLELIVQKVRQYHPEAKLSHLQILKK